MSVDTTALREAILASAKDEFLAYGFTGASLRKIAAKAGATTGALYRHFTDKADLFDALVAPCFHEFIESFKAFGAEFLQKLRDQGQGDALEQNWSTSEQNLMLMTNYIYDHLDTFMLLLSASEKTAYENFTHMMIDMEVAMTLEYIRIAKDRGYPVQDISTTEIHMFVNAQFSAFFEMVLHNIPRETALVYTKSIFEFFEAGWKRVFTGA